MRDPSRQRRFEGVPLVCLQPVPNVAQLHTARNFLRAALARTDGYLDAYPQPLGKHRSLIRKDPDPYSGRAIRECRSAPSAVPKSHTQPAARNILRAAYPPIPSTLAATCHGSASRQQIVDLILQIRR